MYRSCVRRRARVYAAPPGDVSAALDGGKEDGSMARYTPCEMRTPTEALDVVLERIPQADRVETVPLAQAAGRCLAAHALSDVDIPPFEKSMMDGFALASASLDGGKGRLRVAGESRAG